MLLGVCELHRRQPLAVRTRRYGIVTPPIGRPMSEFVLNSDAAIFGIVEALRAQAQEPRSKTKVAKMETEHGFVWVPEGPLADLALRPRLSLTDSLCRDPAHILLLGLVPKELFLLGQRMEATTPSSPAQ